ncbi:hypothetical protein ACFQL8_31640 [Streptomyces goshikiensis]
MVNPGYEALTRSRLVHVDQYYLRADTIAAANAALIAAQSAVSHRQLPAGQPAVNRARSDR